jgi:hypothetical protein
MSSSLGNFSDDFYLNIDLHTVLPLPQARETVLQFCEAAQKQFPDMSDFYQRENGAHVLEGDRNAGSYRWLELEGKRLSSGNFNPEDLAKAYEQHAWILDRSRYFLGVSHLDIESLDLVYGFNLDYNGNRDAIVCDTLLSGCRLAGLLSETESVALNFEPTMIIALDRQCSMQARLAIETRNSSFQVRTGNYEDEPISIYFTIRGYPRPDERFDLAKELARQAQAGEDLVNRLVIPQIIRPIASAIAAQ